jgi:hypothetical protein
MSDATDVPSGPTVPGTPEGFDPNDHGGSLPDPADVPESPREFLSTASPEGPFKATESITGNVDGLLIDYGGIVRFLPRPIAEDFAKFILSE